MKTILAKIIRILTVPPILVTMILTVIYLTHPVYFAHDLRLWGLTVFWLGAFPALAYLGKKTREQQRNTAFVLSVIGYSLNCLCAYFFHVPHSLWVIDTTYLLSVVILLVFNKILHIRASGHACSVIGPCVFALLYIRGWIALPFVFLSVCSIWASLSLKRHCVHDILFGILAFLIAFMVSFLFF